MTLIEHNTGMSGPQNGGPMIMTYKGERNNLNRMQRIQLIAYGKRYGSHGPRNGRLQIKTSK